MPKTALLQVDYDTKTALAATIDGVAFATYESTLTALQNSNGQAYRVLRAKHDAAIAATYRY